MKNTLKINTATALKQQREMASERKPRLCLITKGESGYGFHLHGEKGKNGQFIRKVEPGSPAEASGLRAGDRVVGVNAVNVEKETHHQVSRHRATSHPSRNTLWQQPHKSLTELNTDNVSFMAYP